MSMPPGYNLLLSHKNPVYIELGVWRGDSIKMAIDAGFEKIFGVDADPDMVEFCRNRFDLFRHPNHQQIRGLYPGMSTEILPLILREINQPATIFFDAHYSLLDGEVIGANPFPLMDELKIVRHHHIKTHTLIIDDLLYLTHPDMYKDMGMEVISRKRIIKYIKLINPLYKIELISNPVIKNMLIASL